MSSKEGLTDEEQALWQAHWRGERAARETLILRYTPLVEQVLRVFRNVRPDDRHDLRGAGYYGLVKALDEWQPEGMKWLDFARLKIRFACVDQIRAMSWVPKNIRGVARRVETAEAELTQALGREPALPELAARLAVPVEKAEQMIASFRATDWSVVSFEGRPAEEAVWTECLLDPDAPDPEETALWGEEVDALELVLQRLPALDGQVIRWKFFSVPALSQKEMARRLGVHESRVSQLLAGAIAKARKIAEQPCVLFPEVYAQKQRFTSRD